MSCPTIMRGPPARGAARASTSAPAHAGTAVAGPRHAPLLGRHHLPPRPAASLSARTTRWRRPASVSPPRARSALVTVASASDPRNRTRLATRLVTLPRRVDLYFEGQPFRRILWTAISFGTGFYAANTVSLSFGALSVNDVVAAALTVAFYEVVSAVYHSAPRKTLRLLFLNSFKFGVVVALIADAFKLSG